MLGPNRGENAKGLQRSPFLVINAKGEKILSPKQKDRTTTISKIQKFRNERFNLYSQMFVFQ
jgi:hypothetical protein